MMPLRSAEKAPGRYGPFCLERYGRRVTDVSALQGLPMSSDHRGSTGGETRHRSHASTGASGDEGDMAEDERLAGVHILGDSILHDGVDPGAVRRAVIRDANTRRQQDEERRAAQKRQDRAREARRARAPQRPATPLRARREPSCAHPDRLVPF